jgi:hypothetical protein
MLLPESLLHMLEGYGPRVFAAALSGDHNTPEIIWTAAMRQQRLIPAMLQVRAPPLTHGAPVCVCVCFEGVCVHVCVCRSPPHPSTHPQHTCSPP